MGKVLTDEQIEFYLREGYLYPHKGTAMRTGYSLFLIQRHVRSTLEHRPATLVHGVDECGYRDIDPEPTEENMDEPIQTMPAQVAQYANPEFRQNA